MLPAISATIWRVVGYMLEDPVYPAATDSQGRLLQAICNLRPCLNVKMRWVRKTSRKDSGTADGLPASLMGKAVSAVPSFETVRPLLAGRCNRSFRLSNQSGAATFWRNWQSSSGVVMCPTIGDMTITGTISAAIASQGLPTYVT